MKQENKIAEAKWSYLSNHGHVLSSIYLNHDVLIRDMATEIGITPRAVQRIVRDLEDHGTIIVEKIGRRNRYKIALDQPMIHPRLRKHSLRDFLEFTSK